MRGFALPVTLARMASKVPPARVVAARYERCPVDHLSRLHRRMAPAADRDDGNDHGRLGSTGDHRGGGPRHCGRARQGPLSADELASAVNADADALSRLLRALMSRGIFRQRRDGRYDLTPLADTLRSDADVSLCAFARFLGSPQHREHWSHLTDAVRTGRAVVPATSRQTHLRVPGRRTRTRRTLQRRHDDVSELAIAPVIAGYDFSRYVDHRRRRRWARSAVGRSLGATPQARGILFDLPHVVAGAPALLEEHHVADRVRIGRGFVLRGRARGWRRLPPQGNVIHDWPDDDAVRILGNLRKAADVGKHVLLVESVLPGHDREFAGNWGDLEMLLVVAAAVSAPPPNTPNCCAAPAFA